MNCIEFGIYCNNCKYMIFFIELILLKFIAPFIVNISETLRTTTRTHISKTCFSNCSNLDSFEMKFGEIYTHINFLYIYFRLQVEAGSIKSFLK